MINGYVGEVQYFIANRLNDENFKGRKRKIGNLKNICSFTD
jgi:hypothetical protein